jgi:hypothetical protein
MNILEENNLRDKKIKEYKSRILKNIRLTEELNKAQNYFLDSFLENFVDYIQLNSDDKITLNTNNLDTIARINLYIGNNCLFECHKLFDDKLATVCAFMLEADEVESFRDYILEDLIKNNSLTEIEIPYGVTSIKNAAFEGYNRNIKKISLPDTIIEIGDAAFTGFSSLEEVILPENNKIKIIPYACFSDCENLTAVNIPKGVEIIATSAFISCVSLKKIYVPDSVIDIRNSCFRNCKNLVDVRLSNSLTEISSNCFEKCSSLFQLHIPDSVKSLGQSAFLKCGKLARLTGVSNVEVIDQLCFKDCYNLNLFPRCEKLKKLEKYCFAGSGLSYFYIPKTLNIYDELIFLKCNSLTALYIDKYVSDSFIFIASAAGLDSCPKFKYICCDNKIIAKKLKENNPKFKVICDGKEVLNEGLKEAKEVCEINTYTAGYITEEGKLIELDEYHGEDSSLRGLGCIEFSNTHPQEDTCVRIYKKPTAEQYKELEKIIDFYLDQEHYCKLEIFENHHMKFYKCYSLFEGACQYTSIEEEVGNWTGYKLIRIIKNFYSNKLDEQLLLELNRGQLINKSKASDKYSSKGRENQNRWTRRNKSKIAQRVDQYNKIDMNDFFKKDELKVGINVFGETDDYIVLIRYNGVLREIQEQIKRNNNKLEFKCVLIALQRIFNQGNVFVSCSCGDFRYRIAYNATKGGYNSGQPELRSSNITNPSDTKGAGCKHINLVLGNIDWIMKVASVINNYIHYMKDNYERKYADLIFPKIFGIPYQKAVQLNLFDTDDELASNSDEIKLSNKYGRERTLFRRDQRINNMKNFKDEEDTIDKPLLKLSVNDTKDKEEKQIAEEESNN